MNAPRGEIAAVIFDWAGTIVDFGSLAPVEAFRTLFEANGVPVSAAQARAPMGMAKRAHIEAMCWDPDIRKRWEAAHGAPPAEADIDRLYAAFVPIQIEAIARHADLVPGALEAVTDARRRGARIGSCSGYSRAMMARLVAAAEAAGIAVDCLVTADEVPVGRPSPAMVLLNAIKLDAWPLWRCVKIDDTVPGIAEGVNAGLWTVGVVASGNETALSAAAWDALADDEKNARRAAGARHHLEAGAHFVIDSVADLPPCLDEIEARLARGERPAVADPDDMPTAARA